MERTIKKLFLTVFCLISLTTSITASSHITYFASGTKNILFALGRGIKHFYFPSYDTEDSISSNKSIVSALSLNEDPESPKYLKYWAHKDLVDKDFRWNKKAIRLWAQTSYEQGEGPAYEERIRNLEEDEDSAIFSDSDLENEESIRYAHYTQSIPVREQAHQQTIQGTTVAKSDKITFFSI